MMKKMTVLLMLMMIFCFVACSSEKVEVQGEQFGQSIKLAEAIPVSQVFAQADSLSGKEVRVSGSISDVCKHKGCWIQVTDGNQVLTVRFKDEAFIMPADAKGKNVDCEGLFMAEKIVSGAEDDHSGCGEGGVHANGESCEMMRADKTAKESSQMRYTMVSTGLVLNYN